MCKIKDLKKILRSGRKSVTKDYIHLLFVMFLCPKINLLQMYFLGFVDLEQEEENDFEFLVYNAINIFERLFDLPALMAVSQEFVEIFVFNLFFSSN